MSRGNRPGWYTPAPKKPPPEHGIKMKKAGTTWWGQRWLEALEQVLRGDAGRLSRGRTYARAGRTHDLALNNGRVEAKVTGSRATPYEVAIALKQLADAHWRKAIEAMAEKAQFSAELLAGQMPQAIDEAFRAAGASLFPRQRADLITSCSCPDWGDPCKHVAAAHYVLGEALDRDPFLLFELRGRTKEQVLSALRASRSGAGEARGAGHAERALAGEPLPQQRLAREVPSVALGALTPDEYDKPRAAFPALHFSFAAPASQSAVLRQLGAPAAWSGEETPAELLEPLVRAAAETARRIAMAEDRNGGGEEDAGGELDALALPTSSRRRSSQSAVAAGSSRAEGPAANATLPNQRAPSPAARTKKKAAKKRRA